MNQRINDIIHNYKAGKISPEEANRQLKAEGAGFTLDPEKNPGGGWTQEELEQGFIPAKEGEPWWAPMHTFTGAVRWQDELERYIPEKEMVYNRPKYHGVTVVKGGLRYLYAEDGKCKYQPKSMADYDRESRPSGRRKLTQGGAFGRMSMSREGPWALRYTVGG